MIDRFNSLMIVWALKGARDKNCPQSILCALQDDLKAEKEKSHNACFTSSFSFIKNLSVHEPQKKSFGKFFEFKDRDCASPNSGGMMRTAKYAYQEINKGHTSSAKLVIK